MRVVVAESPSEALRELERCAPGLFMMDLRFPNAAGQPDSREGMALIRRIRQAGYRLPVVVLSGWPEDLYGEPEEEMVSRIMVKPVRIPVLLDHDRGSLLQLPRLLEIFLEPGRDLVGHVRAGAVELRAQALLGGGPDDVPVFVHQAHRGDGFVTPLGGMVRFVFPHADAGGIASRQSACCRRFARPGWRAR